MNEIQTRIIKFTNIRKKSINHCLWALGADWDEVYKIDPKHKNCIQTGKPTIYNLYQRSELSDWAKHLYRQALIENHPDKHPENVRLYTEICQELGKVYLQAVNILNRGK